MHIIRTRFAPSPTGWLHIGGVRTAIFNWLFARHCNGEFILRIEDTDKIRSNKQATQSILEAINWLGLDFDNEPIYQCDRLEIYRNLARKLVKENKAYYCNCSLEILNQKRQHALAIGKKPKYDGQCRNKGILPGKNTVIRFKIPVNNEIIVLNDFVKGKILFKIQELDDLIIERSDGFPTYNFAVVVDDAEMNITHVIRGDDHINNTPRQILLYKALGYNLPIFVHVPMILGTDKTRLSKRHGATSVMTYKEMGYLPEAIVNYLVRLGWSYGDKEIFSYNELIQYFSLDSIGKSAAIFDPKKLIWLNQYYLKSKDLRDLTKYTLPFFEKMGMKIINLNYVMKVVASMRTRSKTILDIVNNSTFFFEEKLNYSKIFLEEIVRIKHKNILKSILNNFSKLNDLSKKQIENFLFEIANQNDTNIKNVIYILRIVLTGKDISPGIDEVIQIFGKDFCIKRIKSVLNLPN